MLAQTLARSLLVAAFPVQTTPSLGPPSASELVKLTASDPGDGDSLGVSVALSGSVILLGAPHDGYPGGPVNATTNVGAAYVYETGPGGKGVRTAPQKLVPHDAKWHDEFGGSVAVDGETAVVGAVQTLLNVPGSAYVFERGPEIPHWNEGRKLRGKQDKDRFGTSVSISGDVIVVGAFWTDHSRLTNAGSAHVFERDHGGRGAWGEVAMLTAPDAGAGDVFGNSVSLSGDIVVVGAFLEDAGNQTDAGAAYVFERDRGEPGSWGFVARLVASDAAPNDHFGVSVALCGETIVVGANSDDHAVGLDHGSAYLFERNAGGPGAWGEVQKLVASDSEPSDSFGTSVAIDGDTVVVGAIGEDGAGGSATGAAYVFERDRGGPGAWGELAKLAASDAETGDGFGWSADVSGNTTLIGAAHDDLGQLTGEISGLTCDPVTNVLYGSDSNGQLVTIDGATGVAALVGPLGFTNVAGLAFDPIAGILYGADVDADELIVIDTATGAGSSIGAIGFGSVQGLAFDPATGMLYGVDDVTDDLIRIDTTTGAGTAIGPHGFAHVWGLAFDPLSGTLYGAKEGSGGVLRLVTIDTITGAATNVGSIGTTVHCLAFAPGANQLLSTDWMDGWFLHIEPSTGAGRVFGGTLYGAAFEAGSAYLFELGPSPKVSYCTAGSSASGCRARLSASGTASATSGAGFDLEAVDVEGNNNGLFYFGTNGRQASGWGNGTSYRCVVPPVVRGGALLGAGTTGACNGSFRQDLNALWAAKPAKNPGAGATVQAQLWYRDPFTTSNRTTSLSDAIEFPVGL